jgi:prepilin-type N-terminal cleavage/methylation domain-containing protein
MPNKQAGFTAIELIVAIVLLAAVVTLVWWQRLDLTTYHQDLQRKTTVNAVYHYLEEVYYPASKAYPEVVGSGTLKGLDPELLKDPSGRALGEPGSGYQYEPNGCLDGKCAGYTLRADLQHENDFVKQSIR